LWELVSEDPISQTGIASTMIAGTAAAMVASRYRCRLFARPASCVPRRQLLSRSPASAIFALLSVTSRLTVCIVCDARSKGRFSADVPISSSSRVQPHEKRSFCSPSASVAFPLVFWLPCSSILTHAAVPHRYALPVASIEFNSRSPCTPCLEKCCESDIDVNVDNRIVAFCSATFCRHRRIRIASNELRSIEGCTLKP
jgi:hypothetical protein